MRELIIRPMAEAEMSEAYPHSLGSSRASEHPLLNICRMSRRGPLG